MIKYKGIKTLEVLEGANNYNRWIAEELLGYAKGLVIEIGSGTGNISAHFLKKKNLYLSESDPGLVKYLKKRFKGRKGVRILNLDILNKDKALKEKFGTVISVNVLEHIKDDDKAIKNINFILKKEGRLLMLVPAKKIAYTNLDRQLGHFRRYEKKDLKKKLEENGFLIEKLFYFNAVGLVSWVVRDKFYRTSINLSPWQVFIFDRLVPLLKKAENIMKPPLGISIIVVARKVSYNK